VLSQEEIDNVFKKLRENAGDDDPGKKAVVYDFRRPDRIAKDQLRAIHLLHENFARALASSLSAYLRAYVAVNLVSVEQLSFMEFTQCLPSPTCMISLGMRPFDGNAVMEINPTLVFPILEMLLGGSGKVATKINREITEIEQSIMEGLLRIVLHDLRTAWHAVTTIDFAIESFETEPQLLQILAPNEAVVAISMEVRIGRPAVERSQNASDRGRTGTGATADSSGDDSSGRAPGRSEVRGRGAARFAGRRRAGIRSSGGPCARYYGQRAIEISGRGGFDGT
jgi:flagellar motor switch protein FliM